MTRAPAIQSLGWLSRWQYRVGQFLRGFRTAVEPSEIHAIVALLSDPELQLFLSMRPRDRRHGAETMRNVRNLTAERGAEASDALLIAALLHDIGKGPLRVEDRVGYVLLQAVSPSLVDRFAQADGGRWGGALWCLRHHATLGAAQLKAIGSAPLVVSLTAMHHDSQSVGDDLELDWLLEADEAA